MKRQRTQKFRKAAIRNLAKFSGIAISATSPSRAGITMAAHRRPDLFGDFAHSTICRASECRECRLSTVLAAENRRAHKERGGFRFGACSATTCDSPLFRVKTIRCHHAAPYEEITYMRDSRICPTNKKWSPDRLNATRGRLNAP